MRLLTRPRLAASLGVLGVLLVAAMPVFAGGWAVATLDAIPTGVTAGQPFTVGFTMRQHGLRPVDWGPITLAFRHVDSRRTVTFTALAEDSAGHYTIDVTLPDAGAWEWTLGEGLIQPMPTLTVQAAVEAATTSPAPVAGAPLGLIVGVAGLAGLGLGLAALIRTRRPWAGALTLSAALVAGLGFTLPPAAPAASNPASVSGAQSAAEQGEALFLAKGCVMCHVHAAVADVRRRTIGEFNSFSTGPDLSNFRASAEYLKTWLKDPASVKPKTEMPDLGLSEVEIDALTVFLNADH